jgi:hypothetical protein
MIESTRKTRLLMAIPVTLTVIALGVWLFAGLWHEPGGWRSLATIVGGLLIALPRALGSPSGATRNAMLVAACLLFCISIASTVLIR